MGKQGGHAQKSACSNYRTVAQNAAGIRGADRSKKGKGCLLDSKGSI